ncbi:MAG: nickel pincer cofactor biosynthesis protein LarB [Geminicoccaceae bacterium]|nr:nickel pincer cofactor biosynthesis protein LarB [Geminicoccaceae bacterium]
MNDPQVFVWDRERQDRLGFDEAIYCSGKSAAHVETILDEASSMGKCLLLTRLDEEKIAERHRAVIDYDPLSRTGIFGECARPSTAGRVAIATAGTSDLAVAHEARRTLAYYGEEATLFADIGVAALWRLSLRIEAVRTHRICIVAAGMDAALPSVIGGLFRGAVIAVPTSVGYGVAQGGRTALDAMLASCAPGIAVCNIDNGYGAACAALRILNAT